MLYALVCVDLFIYNNCMAMFRGMEYFEDISTSAISSTSTTTSSISSMYRVKSIPGTEMKKEKGIEKEKEKERQEEEEEGVMVELEMMNTSKIHNSNDTNININHSNPMHFNR